MIYVPRVELGSAHVQKSVSNSAVRVEDSYLVENQSRVLFATEGDEILKLLAPIVKLDVSKTGNGWRVHGLDDLAGGVSWVRSYQNSQPLGLNIFLFSKSENSREIREKKNGELSLASSQGGTRSIKRRFPVSDVTKDRGTGCTSGSKLQNEARKVGLLE